jgi:hypothetical protein
MEIPAWLRASRAVAASVFGDAASEPIIITLKSGELRAAWTVPPEANGSQGCSSNLSSFEKDVVRILASGPLPAKAIARRMGMAQPTPKLKILLSNLCDRDKPVLELTAAGYRLSEAKTLEVNLPQVIGSAPQARDQVAPAFNEAEQAILEVLRAHGKLTGEKIATLAGYPFDSYFRGLLAGLRRRGAIENLAPGYRVAQEK